MVYIYIYTHPKKFWYSLIPLIHVLYQKNPKKPILKTRFYSALSVAMFYKRTKFLSLFLMYLKLFYI